DMFLLDIQQQRWFEFKWREQCLEAGASTKKQENQLSVQSSDDPIGDSTQSQKNCSSKHRIVPHKTSRTDLSQSWNGSLEKNCGSPPEGRWAANAIGLGSAVIIFGGFRSHEARGEFCPLSKFWVLKWKERADLAGHDH